MLFAEIAVNAAVHVRQTFTYSIPENLPVEIGSAVYVPFGRRTIQGVVLEVTEVPSFPDTRDIEALIEPEPLLLPCQTVLARWLSDYYLASLFDCLALFLPPGFKRRPVTILKPLIEMAGLSSLSLPAIQQEVLREVIERGPIETDALAKIVGVRALAPAIKSLSRRGLVERSYGLTRPRVSPKLVPHLRLLVRPEEATAIAKDLGSSSSSRSVRQAAVLEALAAENPLPISLLRAQTRLTNVQLEDLISRGLVRREKVEIFRDPLAGRIYSQGLIPSLTVDQKHATKAICDAMEKEQKLPFLLHGVTGSGKTEVYLEALKKTIEHGKRAIILVPEISLTPQAIRRFSERFPGQVAVMHSSLSLGEQFDMWHQIKEGKYAVVIGSRSAIFAPQLELGLVVIDEEHEWTFKQQEPSPRYDARRAAEQLCQLTGAVLVLGSATPDVSSYMRSQSKSVHLLKLTERLRLGRKGEGTGTTVPIPLPNVEVVDLRAELKAGNRSIFSRSLLGALATTLEAKQQAILFLNRRGAAAFLQCRDCGHVPSCSRCTVALTYHETTERLVCHHCNRQRRLINRCPKCRNLRIRMLGIGTERVEHEVRRLFPDARTIRWDRDVARNHRDHEQILSRFLAHDADVLVGTQMLAKGLDMPLVTLVGVITADVSLHLPDFRSGERTFQLLEQVAGRAGRGPSGGQVIIQTYTPGHYAVQAAAKHDYAAFYKREIEFRSRLRYPPFGKLAQMTFSHSGTAYSREEAFRMARLLRVERDRRGLPDLDLVGPAPAFIPKLRGRHRWQILLRGRNPAELLQDLSFPGGWTIDVDPVSLL